MTNPDGPQPQPDNDPGHIMPADQWAETERLRAEHVKHLEDLGRVRAGYAKHLEGQQKLDKLAAAQKVHDDG